MVKSREIAKCAGKAGFLSENGVTSGRGYQVKFAPGQIIIKNK